MSSKVSNKCIILDSGALVGGGQQKVPALPCDMVKKYRADKTGLRGGHELKGHFLISHIVESLFSKISDRKKRRRRQRAFVNLELLKKKSNFDETGQMLEFHSREAGVAEEQAIQKTIPNKVNAHLLLSSRLKEFNESSLKTLKLRGRLQTRLRSCAKGGRFCFSARSSQFAHTEQKS